MQCEHAHTRRASPGAAVQVPSRRSGAALSATRGTHMAEKLTSCGAAPAWDACRPFGGGPTSDVVRRKCSFPAGLRDGNARAEAWETGGADGSPGQVGQWIGRHLVRHARAPGVAGRSWRADSCECMAGAIWACGSGPPLHTACTPVGDDMLAAHAGAARAQGRMADRSVHACDACPAGLTSAGA